ncbi:MAG: DUF2993 domain-containing protein [Bacillota bacterium]
MKTLMYFLAVVVLAVMIIIQVMLPQTISTAMEQALEEHWELQNVKVDIKAFPAVKILWGRVDRAEVYVPAFNLGIMPVNHLKISLQNIKIDIIKAVNKEFSYIAEQPGRIEFFVTQEGLNEYLKQNPITGISDVSIELKDSQSIVKCQIMLLGRNINLSLLGRFSLGKDSLVFVPEDLVVQDHSLGDVFKDRVKTGVNLEVNLINLPFDTRLTGLEAGDGYLKFTGEIGGLKI